MTDCDLRECLWQLEVYVFQFAEKSFTFSYREGNELFFRQVAYDIWDRCRQITQKSSRCGAIQLFSTLMSTPCFSYSLTLLFSYCFVLAHAPNKKRYTYNMHATNYRSCQHCWICDDYKLMRMNYSFYLSFHFRLVRKFCIFFSNLQFRFHLADNMLERWQYPLSIFLFYAPPASTQCDSRRRSPRLSTTNTSNCDYQEVQSIRFIPSVCNSHSTAWCFIVRLSFYVFY